MKQIEEVYIEIKRLCEIQQKKGGAVKGVTTKELVTNLSIQRPNVSAMLNTLVKEGRLSKIKGKPVLYKINFNKPREKEQSHISVFDKIIGSEGSLKTAIKQAKAAIVYPSNGLHSMIVGETGVGKSMFAEQMYRYAKEINRIKNNAPFISFNCADYANNPQLLLSVLFGVRKGSYTGADRDREGLVKKANGGVLFLDEIHRLPAEGQEMLFYLFDKGLYRKLGEDDVYQKSDVIIICATTENIDSGLLRAFIRRVPMVIKLPSLRFMTTNERWQLVKYYFKQQARDLKTSIEVSPNTVKAFLLYDCINNIGQLISDIKLSCARTFLEYISDKEKEMYIDMEYIPEYVQRGLFHYKEQKDKFRDIGIMDGKIIFTADEDDIDYFLQSNLFNIYDALERKMTSLKKEGFNENDRHLIMSLELEKYIKKYMHNTYRGNFDELYKIVDKEIVEVTREFINHSLNTLNVRFDEKIVYGMSIHISCTFERIKNNKPIINPNLAEIKNAFPVEFQLASKFALVLEEKFNVKIPEDEKGFITMFLVLDDYVEKQETGRVGIIVAMHGESAATSIADVSNRLLGTEHALGYNMSLEQKTEVALENLTQLVKETDEGKGVLLLVDMGSLLFLGDMIFQKTNIHIKTIEMVSTPMVLEATRKALMFASLEQVYQGVIDFSPYIGRMYSTHSNFNNNVKDDVIITACITGEGAAIKLKSIIENSLSSNEERLNILPDILPIEINSLKDYSKKLEKIKKEKNIIAVVSSVEPKGEDITYISAEKLLIGNGIGRLNQLLSTDKSTRFFNRMKKVINENIDIDGEKFIESFKAFNSILKDNGVYFDHGILSGLILHIACVIEKLIKGQEIKAVVYNDEILKEHFEEYEILKKAFVAFGALDVQLPANEYINVLKLIHSD